jgi:GT2 family glycosyltransferase
MTVSVVVAHYGAEELIHACLAALWKNTELPVEVVVVDNGTGHDIDADVVIHNDINVGFSVACNQGAAAADGDMLVFLNNDTEVRAGWLEPLVAAMAPDVAAVGSLLLYPDGTIQHSGVGLDRGANGVIIPRNLTYPMPPGDVGAVTAACVLVDRKKFFEVGGFDEEYWCGNEDVDLCYTFRSRGWRIRYEPGSVVTHHGGASGGARWVAVRQNVARFHSKWADYEPAGVVT